jgi:hypothetical protein
MVLEIDYDLINVVEMCGLKQCYKNQIRLPGPTSLTENLQPSIFSRL